MAGFNMRKTDIAGVPEHYMSVLSTEFYIPTYLENAAVTAHLPNGQPDAVSTLYNDINVEPWPADVLNKDQYNITVPQGEVSV
jgi:hypothetical protein